jgi:hypothetical protein
MANEGRSVKKKDGYETRPFLSFFDSLTPFAPLREAVVED